MKKLLWSVPLLIMLSFFTAYAGMENFKVQWDPITVNADGTPLTDLDHYQFVICEAPIGDDGSCPLNPKNVNVASDMLETSIDYTTVGREGTVFVRGIAVDTTGNRSMFSNTASMQFKDDVAPQSLTIRIKLP